MKSTERLPFGKETLHLHAYESIKIGSFLQQGEIALQISQNFIFFSILTINKHCNLYF